MYALPASDDLEAPQQNKTGPTPPIEVTARDALKPSDTLDDRLSEVTLAAPAYAWRHGCGPTAVAMVVGYYDTTGYDDLIPGSAATQTSEVNQTITSGGDANSPCPPGSERPCEDYARPQDSSPTLLTDDYITAARTPHNDDCVADYTDTSKSTRNNYYGWSWSSDVGPPFVDYVNQQNPAYAPGYQEYYWNGTLSWDVLVGEINAGRPMVFLVDSDGNGGTDHFVAVIAYRSSPSLQYGSWDTWSTSTIRWENFAAIASGVPWGIWGGWALRLSAAPPQPPAVTIAADSPDVLLSWPPVTEDIDDLPLTIAHYDVYRDELPYTTPGPVAYAEPTGTSFRDPGALNEPNYNYYYLVRAESTPGLSSADSCRKGKFTFSLVAGNP